MQAGVQCCVSSSKPAAHSAGAHLIPSAEAALLQLQAKHLAADLAQLVKLDRVDVDKHFVDLLAPSERAAGGVGMILSAIWPLQQGLVRGRAASRCGASCTHMGDIPSLTRSLTRFMQNNPIVNSSGTPHMCWQIRHLEAAARQPAELFALAHAQPLPWQRLVQQLARSEQGCWLAWPPLL